MAVPIYLYVPNIIGYLRVAATYYAFAVAFTNRPLFVALYLGSFIGDYLDGRFALWLNQKSTFGAVLDMVTDRLSTAGLLLLLSHLYQTQYLFFIALIFLDIGSHWFQMYSSQLSRKMSHKEVSQEDVLLMRVYYSNRFFMGYCCIGAEMLYLALYLLHSTTLPSHASIADHFLSQSAGKKWSWRFSASLCLGGMAFSGWGLKQIINIVQLIQAAQVCVKHDLLKGKDKAK